MLILVLETEALSMYIMESFLAEGCQLDSTKWPEPVRRSIISSVFPKHKLSQASHNAYNIIEHMCGCDSYSIQ